MRETKHLEFKEIISNTFIKTVSAFSNFESGKIMFGIKDGSGEIVGIDNPDQACLDIENKINDLVKPKPKYSLSINRNTNVITLEVKEGPFKPYLYRGKAYKRSDTSTVEIDDIELRRLSLLGANLYYDELTIEDKNLTFNFLSKYLKEKLSIDVVNEDTLKTLGLLGFDHNYNYAALLLSDQNYLPGIDIIRFGKSISDIHQREIIEETSILKQLDRTVEFFEMFYKVEKIKGMERLEDYLIPLEAFRETVANALVHRTWDINAKIRISMFEDRIEIYSPGGLPTGLQKNDYINGYISTLRNPIIANVFFRLKIIEMFGTGIKRIKEEYENYEFQPIFEVTDNSIVTVLPSKDMKEEITLDEKTILDNLSAEIMLASSDLVTKTGFSKDKVVRLINSLIKKQYVIKEGGGRSTKYKLL